MPTFNRPNLSFREEGVVRRIARGLTLLTSCLVALALAAPAWSVTMESVEFSSLPGDKTEIRMTFDGTPPEPTGYTIEQPARIVLDMPGVESSLEDKHHNLGIGNARRMSVVSTKDRTRAIVNLTQLVSYETEIQGNTLYLTVGSGGVSGVPAPQEYSAMGDVSASGGQDLSDSQINNVDFRRGEDGGGRVIIDEAAPATRVAELPERIQRPAGDIVEAPGTELCRLVVPEQRHGPEPHDGRCDREP